MIAPVLDMGKRDSVSAYVISTCMGDLYQIDGP